MKYFSPLPFIAQSYFDIALLESDSVIDYSLKVWPVCLPSKATDELSFRYTSYND